MLTRMSVILDLTIENNPIFQLIEKYQTILEICSNLINLYYSENPGTQVIIIVSKNQHIGQLTHLTGNIQHHNQGIWCFIYGNRKIGDFDLGFFFNERIQVLKCEITKYELFFISEGNLNFLGSNFFAVFMGKETRKFTIISQGIKSFGLQILTKITGGKYINLINKQKRILANILLGNFGYNLPSETTYFQEFTFIVNRLILKKVFLGPTSKVFVKKLAKFCPLCRKSVSLKKINRCKNCGIFLTSQPHLFHTNNCSLKGLNLKKNFLQSFNLFGPIIFEKRFDLSLRQKQIFNFFKNKKINSNETSQNLTNKSINTIYNEILLGKFY